MDFSNLHIDIDSRNYFFISENSSNETCSQFHWFTTIRIFFPEPEEENCMSSLYFDLDFKNPTAIDLAATSGSKDIVKIWYKVAS